MGGLSRPLPRHPLLLQARDEDSEDNGIIMFSILKAEFVRKDGTSNPVQVFRITRSVEAGLFTGSIEYCGDGLLGGGRGEGAHG